MRTLVVIILAISSLLFAEPLLAQGAAGRSLAARNEAASLVFYSSEAVAAERRVARRETNALRGTIDGQTETITSQRIIIEKRDEEIKILRTELHNLGGTNQFLQNKIDELTKTNLDDKEAYSRELAQKDADYSRALNLLIEAATNLLETEEGAQALALFNSGDQSDWERAKLVLAELNRVSDELEQLRRAARLRAIANLYFEKFERGQEPLEGALNAWQAVVGTQATRTSDWIIFARLQRQARRFEAALFSAEEAAKLAQTNLERALALTELAEVNEYLGNPQSIGQFEAAAREMQDAELNWNNELGDYIFYISSLRKEAYARIVFNQCQEAQSRLTSMGYHYKRLEEMSLFFPVFSRELAVFYSDNGDASHCLEQNESALYWYYRANSEYSRVFAYFPDEIEIQRNRTVLLNRLSRELQNAGRFQEAKNFANNSLEIARNLADQFPNDARSQEDLAFAHELIGDLYRTKSTWDDAQIAIGNYIGAWDAIDKAISLGSESSRLFFHFSDFHLRAIGVLSEYYGTDQNIQKTYQNLNSKMRSYLEDRPTSIQIRSSLSTSLSRYGDFLLERDRNQEALDKYLESVSVVESLLRDRADSYEFALSYVETMGRVGNALAALGLSAEAVRSFEASLSEAQRVVLTPEFSARANLAIVVILAKLAHLDPRRYPWRRAYEKIVEMDRNGQLGDNEQAFINEYRGRMEAQEAGQVN